MSSVLAETNITLPTQDNLPADDGEPMETERHRKQMELLITTLEPWLVERQQGYVNGNMFVYYTLEQLRHLHLKGPDVFVVLDVPLGERKSWVSWEEGKTPDIVIELLSSTTKRYDQTEKKLVYQNQLKVAEYFWYDPFNPADWKGFQLMGGIYQEMSLDTQQRLVSQKLGLALVRWIGTFHQVQATWLRWATLEGELLLLPEEAEKQRADRAEVEIAQLKALLAKNHNDKIG
jgi:Uma2 family endonuclease